MDAEQDVAPSLSSFLSAWRRELASRERDRLLGGDEEGAEWEERTGPEPEQSVKRAAQPREPSPLLVLPPVSASEPSGRESVGGGGERGEVSLVDTLIADLDEINTVPFFDVQLPREIALVIFSFLDSQDLCSCARVSRSWQSLAEDNMLWCRICHCMGYETGLDVQGHVRWKAVVREIVLRRRRTLRNWKERVCGVSDYQPDSVGVLCCVDYCFQQILACYSSGSVHCWTLGDADGPVSVAAPPPPPPPPSCCALSHGWAAVGTKNGVQVIDTESCSEEYRVADLCPLTSVAVGVWPGGVVLVAGGDGVMVLVEGGGGRWGHTLPRLPRDCKVTRVALVPTPSTSHPFTLLYSTLSSLTLLPLHSSPSSVTPLLTSAGCVSCFDFTPTTLACGTTAFGHRVQLFDLASGVFTGELRGHGMEVLAVNIASAPPQHLVTGSADKRVRVFDLRCPYAVLTLRGHGGGVRSVQMDEWRVVSGSVDGNAIVWDQRMAGELWRSHDRHPVELCRFQGDYLITAHVPTVRPLPVVWRDPNIHHRRQRGLVRVFNFSVDGLYYTRRLPSICSSTYDEPSASFYNLDLRVPYDTIA